MQAIGCPGDRQHVRHGPEASPDRAPLRECPRQVLPLHVPCSGELTDVGDRGLHFVVEEIRPDRVDRRHVGAPGKLEVLERFVGPDEASLGRIALREGLDDCRMDGILGSTGARLRAGILEEDFEPQSERRAEPRVRFDRGGIAAFHQVDEAPGYPRLAGQAPGRPTASHAGTSDLRTE